MLYIRERASGRAIDQTMPWKSPPISMSVCLLLKKSLPPDRPTTIMPPDGNFSITMSRDPSTEDIERLPPRSPPLWQEVSNRKKAEREGRLARRPGWRLSTEVPPLLTDVSNLPTSELTPREFEIVHLDVTALAEALRALKYTAVETLEAFCHVATIAQDVTNCLTEVFFDEGLRRAQDLDRHLAETGKVVGPLHGVPVSIKDHILVEGHDTSTGYVAWAGRTIAEKDALVVKILREAGAVIYVKTANPQTLLSLETNNNIFGRTVHPYNRLLTSGGSSGGESALIAVHGSPLGIGTDIGGSIRIPAAYTGLYGLKGSVGRMPHAGLMGSHDGMDAIVGALGPLATSARDLALFCQVMLQHEPWIIEHSLFEIPWRQEIVDGEGIPDQLSIAVLWDDGVVVPHPPILDALRRTTDALTAAGHDVVIWDPVDHEAAWELITKLYFLDGGEEYREVMRNEPWVPQTEWILSQVPNGGKPFSIAEVFKLNLEREAFRTKLAAHWNATKSRTSTGRHVDAVLCPVAATLAPPHDTTRWWGYTSYWNLLDYSAVVFPAGRFHAAGYRPLTWPNGALHTGEPRNETERFIRAQWKPETYDNVSVGLQLVGRRLNEERLLGVLCRVEEAVQRFHDL